MGGQAGGVSVLVRSIPRAPGVTTIRDVATPAPLSVIVFHPRTSEYGGTVAAPVFSEVASYALQELGIAPSGATATPYASEW